ncbi:hypothetical protein KUTeg_021792, partial [Tegillarca granosa]
MTCSSICLSIYFALLCAKAGTERNFVELSEIDIEPLVLCDGDLEHDRWVSILNHVTDMHERHQGKFQQCLHGPLKDRGWIKKDSLAFLEQNKVVKGNLLLKDKEIVCSRPDFRLYIAALHFNKNGNRQQICTQDGTPMYSISYPKSRKGEALQKKSKYNKLL